MINTILLLAAGSLAASPGYDVPHGSIGGMVVNGTQSEAPLADTQVVLRVYENGVFLPAAQTTSDQYGSFLFEDLPVGDHTVYLPGANRAGVHYPGPRLRLEPQQADVRVKLVVYDAIPAPSPLTVPRHDVVVRVEPGVLKVTEKLLVANRTRTAYVGQPASGDPTSTEVGAASDETVVTLALSIPGEFEKVTFHKEFDGRRFKVREGKLETDIPWPPGQRELEFTYYLPLEQRHHVWTRPLDLPTSQVRVQVITDGSMPVSCSLPRRAGPDQQGVGQQGAGQEGSTFQSQGTTLEAGHVIRLEIGNLPVSWMASARWIAVAMLAGLVALAAFGGRQRLTGSWRSPSAQTRQTARRGTRSSSRVRST